MATLIGLEKLKVTKSTVKAIQNFVWENKSELSNEMKLFYNDVAAIVEHNARKSKKDWSKITNMNEVLEKAYNIEKYILAAGAASYEVQFA